ncbi:hypothetical protein ACRW5F_14955, partial [Escherichia coli]
TADPGGPATISSQAYAYYMQNVPFCIFVPTAHHDLSLAVRCFRACFSVIDINMSFLKYYISLSIN